jgi:AcrR family transcriptional regulator
MTGLRERKKRLTRDAIAAVAMELFRARGFDAVTVADVARAADVSEKTVFNYFPAKEDLVFHRREERIAALIDTVRSRPPGTPLLEPFRGTHRSVFRTAFGRLLAGEDRRLMARRLRAEAQRAYDLVARGLAGY